MRRRRKRNIVDLLEIRDIEKRRDYFIQNYIVPHMNEFKKNKGKIDKFISVFPENLIEFKYSRALKMYINKDLKRLSVPK